jgi:large subunit ribosomal protein L14
MIQLRSVLIPADNTGAKFLKVIGIPGSNKKVATIGDVVNAVVDRSTPNGSVADREKVKVVIVRTKKEVRRKDGSYVRFSENAGVIIDAQGNPKGTRIFGPIAREVRDAGYNRIASLAMEVV